MALTDALKQATTAMKAFAAAAQQAKTAPTRVTQEVVVRIKADSRGLSDTALADALRRGQMPQTVDALKKAKA